MIPIRFHLLAPAVIVILLCGCGTSPAFISSQAATEQTPQILASTEITKITAAAQNASTVQKSDGLSVSVPPNKVTDLQDSVQTVVVEEENNIYFTFGATKIDLEGQRKLQAHASNLKQNSDLGVTLTGYTDNLGSRSYNQAIAERRTEEVRNVLRSYGVKKNQIRSYEEGNEKSDPACKTLACRQKMRRVSLSYRE